MKSKTKHSCILFGVILFFYLSFGFFSDKERSANPTTPPVSALDRARAVLERAQQAQEDIFILGKSDPLVKGALKKEEKSTVNESAAVFPVYGNHWGKEEITELRDFSKWADEYADSSHRTKEQLEQGVELAKARREIMRILIEMNPEAALASVVPRYVLMQLPDSVRNHVEQRISGVGTLQVIGVSPEKEGESAVSLTQRSAMIDGVNYKANVYGTLRAFGYTEQLYLHGVVVDGKIALADTPMRPLEVGEQLDPKLPVAARHSVNRSIANRKRDKGLGPFFVEDQKGYHCLCCSDPAWDDYNLALTRAWGSSFDGETAAAVILRAYNNTGAKKVLVIPVEFPDNTGSPWSSNAVRNSRASDVVTFFNTVSYGKFTLSTVDMSPLQMMDNNASSYEEGEYLTLKDHAVAKARTAGYDSDDYDFVAIVINHNLYPTWAGRGQVGAKFSWVDGPVDQVTGVYTHELGHNLGLWHANSWESATLVADDTYGSHDEYGHIFDCMGMTSATTTYDQEHFNASFKNALDWLPDIYVTTLSDGDSDTSVDLYAMDQTQISGRTYAVKLDVGVSLGSNTDLDYWIEFRTRYPANSTLDDGVLVYFSNDAHEDKALKLLDMNPATSSFNDAGLDMSKSFSIAGGRWKVTVNSQSGSGADSYVNVSFEDVRSPTITTQPADTSAEYGTSVTLSVSATGPSLSYQWYKDGAELSGETGSPLTIPDFQEANKGDYHVVVTNAYGTETSSTATLSESTGGGGGGGGGCGSMPPVNLVVIGWFSLLFSRLCLWLNFGEPRTFPVTPKAKKKTMKTQIHILLLAAAFLWIGCGCQSVQHSGSSTYWQPSSTFHGYSRFGSHGYRPYPQSVKLPNKPISQMNREELEKTAQAINWANQINRGYHSYDWPHERRLNIWLKKP